MGGEPIITYLATNCRCTVKPTHPLTLDLGLTVGVRETRISYICFITSDDHLILLLC